MAEYKHQQVGMPFPVYCTDRDASAVRMLMWSQKQHVLREIAINIYGESNVIQREKFATDPAELRWMADISAGDDVWGS